jgi:catechol 2,3-dioxygenase-like lactoylglutathione lyase family enzyme
VGWGIAKPVFFVFPSELARPGSGHVCFAASGIPAVKAAWEAGIRAGGTDDGSPGARSDPAAGSYSAYLLDPDGHRVEIAVSPQ